MDWVPHEQSPSHLSLFTSKTLTSPRLELIEAEKSIGENENWNLLYVAMTRARQGLWISGDAQKPTKNNPDGLDKSSWYGKASNAGIPIAVVPVEMEHKESLRPTKDGTHERAIEDFVLNWLPAIQNQDQLQSDIEGGLTLEVFVGDGKQVDEPDPEILEEGSHFHQLLEMMTTQTSAPLMQAMPSKQEIVDWLGIHEEHAEQLIKRVTTVLEAPALRKYLTDGSWVQAWNELDIASQDGKSFRMDRLVEFDTHLAIIDYKLTIPPEGSEQYEKYCKQLANYQKVLERIRSDKPSKAFLISSLGELKQLL
jgi:ATP-dependent helicase/nuclease subunit A